MDLRANELDEDDHEGWANLCDEMVQTCENELPEAAEEFAESVIEKLTGIAETIARKRNVTEGQRRAIVNIEEAIGKWTGR